MKKLLVLSVLAIAACAHHDPKIALPDDQTLTKLRGSLDGQQRSEAEKARDPYRHPLETLTFWGLRDDATVVELLPGKGWYTAVLAPVLVDRGHLIVAVDGSAEEASEALALKQRIESSADIFSHTETRVQHDGVWDLGEGASADLIITSRSLHYLTAEQQDALFKAVYETLKPGGVFGVEDHRANPGDTRDAHATGYISGEAVIRRIESVTPLKLAARSEINANKKDAKDYDKGVWALPPTLENGELDKAKYLAIGESDRFTLAFVKPYN